jgi:hypothetical protein
MPYSLEIQEEIETLASWLDAIIPPEIKRAISLAQDDLYSGPVFVDENGETCEWCDKGSVPFDFKAACREIRDWLDENILDIKIETSYDEEADKSEYESIDGTGKAICEKLLGRELLAMIY